MRNNLNENSEEDAHVPLKAKMADADSSGGDTGKRKSSTDEVKDSDSVGSSVGKTPTSSKRSRADSTSSSRAPSAEAVEANEKMVIFLTGKPSSARSRYAKAFKFPTKLYYTLECGEYDDVISWTANGRAFQVHKAQAFSAKVLPTIFREAKFSSFHRKLNRWNFIKIPGKQGAYSHPLFRRGELNLCRNISCSGNSDIVSSFPGELSSILDSELALSSGGAGGVPRGQYGAGGSALPPLSDGLLGVNAGGINALSYHGGVDLRRSLLYQDTPLGLNQHQARVLDGQVVPVSLRSAAGGTALIPSSSFYLGAAGRGDLLQEGAAFNQPSVPDSAAYSRIAELESELWQYRQMRARVRLANNPLMYEGMSNNVVYYPNEFDSFAGAAGYQSQLDRRDMQLGIGFPASSIYQQQQQQQRALLMSDRQGAGSVLNQNLPGDTPRMPPLYDPAAGINLSFQQQAQRAATLNNAVEEKKVRQHRDDTTAHGGVSAPKYKNREQK